MLSGFDFAASSSSSVSDDDLLQCLLNMSAGFTSLWTNL